MILKPSKNIYKIAQNKAQNSDEFLIQVCA